MLRYLLKSLILLVALSVQIQYAGADGPGISIELNKAEDTAGASCLVAFVMRNEMESDLDRFNLDLYVFDQDGIIARQIVLDLAPLRGAKTTVVRFPLIDRPCGRIGRVLVNDIPSCRSAATGEDLDCLDGLSVSSRSRIELTK